LIESFHGVFPYVLVVAKGILAFVAVIMLVSGLDDFFFDIYYAVRSLYRRLFVLRKYRPLTEEDLLRPTEQAIAVMIPAWRESAVIRPMLENSLRTFNYGNYHIFVGTYPNDEATEREVEKVRENCDNIHRITCPHDGPTNKADCLNWIYQGISLFEQENRVEFALFVMEDSEDIVHPLALKLFNYLIPRKDMVQLAVLPLKPAWYKFTEGHYIDEFAENHYKNLVVREFLSGVVPSAGVGCAFSRKALALESGVTRNELFNVNSLCEDYEIGMRLRRLGVKQIFVRQAIERTTSKPGARSRKRKEKKSREFIAVAEYFPSNIRAAVRQKARWIVGICFQAWKHLRWEGSLAVKYMLFRDRKTLITSYINALGYLVVLVIVIYWMTLLFLPEPYRYPPLVEAGTWLWYVILADTFFMAVRLFSRFFCVFRFYGPGQALLSVPRFVWGNVINFFATSRATFLFGRHLVTGKYIAWDKTDHSFPSAAELQSYRRRLGEMLLEKRFITVKKLEEALARQQKDRQPLGAVLLEMGWVREEDLIQVLSRQLFLSTARLDPEKTSLELLSLLPEYYARKYSVYPVEMRKGGRLLIAGTSLLGQAGMEELEKALHRPIDLCLTTRNDVADAIQRGYDRLARSKEAAEEHRPLGWRLMDRGLITSGQLLEALSYQRRSYWQLAMVLWSQKACSAKSLLEAAEHYPAASPMPFGEFLVRREYISQDQLEKALPQLKTPGMPLGKILVDMSYISDDELKSALEADGRKSKECRNSI
jgi:adsorption protein B